jgi:hypothetical protein
MKTPRFDNDGRRGAPSRFGTRTYPHPKWIRVSHIGDRLRRDASGLRRCKIFAIVAAPMPTDPGRKAVRNIVIFDDHPDSLRLVSRQRLNPQVDLAAPRHTSPSHVLLGLVLILALMLGMLWPLIVR